MIVAIIPARGGSKRIPKKNIKNFFGRPIIGWTIDIVKKTKIFDKIIVSTDDKRIASIAKYYNAEVPFMRPSRLSGNKSSTSDVIIHAILWLKKKGYNPKEVCCIYPTSSLIQPRDLKNSLRDLKTKKWEYVFSATTFEYSIFRAIKYNKKKQLQMVFPKLYNNRSQDLQESYHDAGQFYWAFAKSWLNKKKIFGKKSKMTLLPRWRVQDIDNIYDWKKAEIIFRMLRKKKKTLS